MTTTAVLSFDVDAESAILAVGRRYADHAMAMTHQAFGPRVGVPRILALLPEYGLPAPGARARHRVGGRLPRVVSYQRAAAACARTDALTRSSAGELRRHCCQ